MVTVRNFEVLSDELNVERICALEIISSQNTTTIYYY